MQHFHDNQKPEDSGVSHPAYKKPFKEKIVMQESFREEKKKKLKRVCVAWISGGRIIASSIMALVRSLLLIKTY